MVITGPEVISVYNVKILTVSKPIVDKNNNFQGVASIDIKVPDLQDILQNVIFYTTGFLYLVDLQTGLVLNDPFDIEYVYHIWDSNITGLTTDAWNQISDASTSGQVLNI